MRVYITALSLKLDDGLIFIYINHEGWGGSN
jgi:hypothetical protein